MPQVKEPFGNPHRRAFEDICATVADMAPDATMTRGQLLDLIGGAWDANRFDPNRHAQVVVKDGPKLKPLTSLAA